MSTIWNDVGIALAEAPVNVMALIDDTDFKSIEDAIAYNAAGMDLVWNFVTTGGAFSQTAVTPGNSGNYLWTNQGKGFYTLQIPASGGASINNNAAGFGFFAGKVTGVLPFRGPTIGFRSAALNDALIDGTDKLQVDLAEVNGLPVGTGQVNVNVVNQTTFQNGKLTIIRAADYAAGNSNLVRFTDVANVNAAENLYLSLVDLQTSMLLVNRKLATAFSEGAQTADFTLTAAEANLADGTQYAFVVERLKSTLYNPILLGPCEVRANNRTF